MDAVLPRVAELLSGARHAVAFTGAGISTESGIPDFRSPGGVWSQSQPVYFDDFLASAEARYEYWRQKAVAQRDFAEAAPNAGHRILAHWQNTGLIKALITQNIDGLHQEAGSREVFELHGTARWVRCLKCPARYDAQEMVAQFLAEDRPPVCRECGGLTKHATISFGQTLPSDVLSQAFEHSAASDLFLAIGSSLVVYPAAGLPVAAAEAGSHLVIINRDATPMDGRAEAVVRTPIGETLVSLDEQLK